jgi:hypothetical protein
MKQAMKRTSLFLPEELTDRLRAESARSGVTVAELVRRACDAVTPPVDTRLGDLKPLLDKVGFLQVLVLNAREGKFQVEPHDPVKVAGDVQLWVPSHLVTFPDQSSPFWIPSSVSAFASERTMISRPVVQHEEIVDPPKDPKEKP